MHPHWKCSNPPHSRSSDATAIAGRPRPLRREYDAWVIVAHALYLNLLGYLVNLFTSLRKGCVGTGGGTEWSAKIALGSVFLP